MILLSSTSDTLQFTTAGAESTDWNAAWNDVNFAAGTMVPGSTEGNQSAAGTVALIAAPAAGDQRQVKFLSFVNNDPALTQTVTVQKVGASGTFNLTGAYPLAPGWALQYIDSHGFMILNAAGAIQYVGSAGAAGPTGPAGPTGAAGSTGPAGTAATIAAGTATGLSAGASPTVGNSGTSSAAVFNFGIPAGAMGAAGATGATGPTGPTGSTGPTGAAGAAATIAAGSATGLAAGASPTVTNTGTSSAAVFAFGIPAGAVGATGPTGSTGATGAAGAAATVTAGTATGLAAGASPTVGNSGTSAAAVFNFGIPAGATGAPGSTGAAGAAGAAATITAGTASALAAGASPTVTNSGTSSAAVFNFGIPAGATGSTGSAGSTGAAGAAATIAAGTATGLAAGASPTVSNSGSSSAAVFNFGIPAGATGAAGAPASSANPSASVGLSAVNGTATTFMTSDSAPKLSQSITPTWTGAHTFSAALTANGGLTVTGAAFTSRGITDSATATALTIASTGAVTIAAPSSAVGLSLTGATNQWTSIIQSSTTSGQGNGVLIYGGTTSADNALYVKNAANTHGLFQVQGGGNVVIGFGSLTVSGSLGINGAAAPVEPTGYGTPTGGAHQSSFAASSITLANLAAAVAQLVIDLKAYGLIGA